MVGSWDFNVEVGKLPQKVATAVAKLNETIAGTEYTPIAYLGSQVVNGVNYAVLAEQLVVTGKDAKNIVILIFNEKPNSMDIVLTGIDRVIESSTELGGITVDVKTDIPEEAQKVFDKSFEIWIGCKIRPFALIGTQVTHGINYFYMTKLIDVGEEHEYGIALAIANPVSIDDNRVIRLLEHKI